MHLVTPNCSPSHNSCMSYFYLIGWGIFRLSSLLVGDEDSAQPCEVVRKKNGVSILCPLDGIHLIASSNTLLRLRCVNAEHSRYFCALISFATMTACSYCIGVIFFCRRFSLVVSSSLRSNLVPTSMIGTPGAWWSISGYHYRKCQDEERRGMRDDIP